MSHSKWETILSAVAFYLCNVVNKSLYYFSCTLPVFLVDAVLHSGRCKFPLYQPCFLQLIQMLWESALGYRYDFRHVAMITAVLVSQQLQNGNPYRMSQCLGDSGNFHLLFSEFFFGHNYYYSWFVSIRKYTNCFIVRKYTNGFYLFNWLKKIYLYWKFIFHDCSMERKQA